MLISIDHGNKQIKTARGKPFTSGLRESTTPFFHAETLFYQGKFYTLVDERIPYCRDKTEDERFFVLTLFAIGRELAKKDCRAGADVLLIQLAVGLPPAHYGAQHQRFERYFLNRGIIEFFYQQQRYSIQITDAMCFPQAYAAAVTMFQALSVAPKTLIIDIGGFTADYLQMKNGEAQLGTCDSLENGVIVFYNRIKSTINADFDILLDEDDIDAIIQGHADFSSEINDVVAREAFGFVHDLFSTLRERMIDLRSGQVVFTGGGSILLRRQILKLAKAGSPIVVEDINANAKGYEILYQVATAQR